jgi:hypothetical protein
MSIFPFIQNTNIVTNSNNELPIPREYAWDFKNDEFVMKDEALVIVEGLEALRVWIYHALKITRYKHIIFSWNYGSELNNLIGSSFGGKVAESETKRYVEEALSINPHISGVKNLVVSINDDKLSLEFIAVTDLGEVNVSV